jgi:hypothetical protein
VNKVRHCHLNIDLNGDPLIMYRTIDNNTIRLMFLTTHNAAFPPKRRELLIKQYETEFPITEDYWMEYYLNQLNESLKLFLNK